MYFTQNVLLYNYNFSPAARPIKWFLWFATKSNNYYFTVKSLLVGNITTVESTVVNSPTNFDQRLPTALKKLLSLAHAQ